MNVDFTVYNPGAYKKELKGFFIERPRGSDCYLFIFFVYKTNIKIGDKEFIAEPNSCAIIQPNIYQRFQPCDDYFINSYFYFVGEKAEEYITQLNIPINTVFYPHYTDFITEYIRNMETEYFNNDINYHEFLDNTVKNFFIELARSCYKKEKVQININREDRMFDELNKVRVHFLSLPEKHYNVETMAKYAGLSRSRFTVLYKKFFHISPQEDLINARIEKAKYYLSYKKFTIKEISIMLGYENISHFSRQFKSKTGATPNQYREHNANKNK